MRSSGMNLDLGRPETMGGRWGAGSGAGGTPGPATPCAGDSRCPQRGRAPGNIPAFGRVKTSPKSPRGVGQWWGAWGGARREGGFQEGPRRGHAGPVLLLGPGSTGHGATGTLGGGHGTGEGVLAQQGGGGSGTSQQNGDTGWQRGGDGGTGDIGHGAVTQGAAGRGCVARTCQVPPAPDGETEARGGWRGGARADTEAQGLPQAGGTARGAQH